MKPGKSGVLTGGPEAAGVSHDNPRAQTCTFEGRGASNTTKFQREDLHEGRKERKQISKRQADLQTAFGAGQLQEPFWLKVCFLKRAHFSFCSLLFVRTVFAKPGSQVEISGRTVWVGPDHPSNLVSLSNEVHSLHMACKGRRQGSVHSKTRV